ncbi:tyrosyl-tRNA synthetase [Candidatus Phytoplasma luffae]|uniref:Tyrosine--tRNA ligase n=1 Tax=Loofah witches'-broom phytoplasma TaxID=35773 RepID=A0A975FJY3_LOWBP|nr:tyrosine--tRNA ligase [Candidatus Phytoplasma luffae]QTX03167.1 tyrosyl-tRNA synthetase [Candidatus Phytoplasma luffae]
MLLFEELKWRYLIKDCSDQVQLEKTLNTKKINFYCGIDPTSTSLTVGHLVQIITALLLKKHGHTPFIVIGGTTCLIGDPKEKEERKLLKPSQIIENVNKIKKQLKKLLFNKGVVFVNNFDWLSKIDLITFLRTYGKNFNINYMLSKDIISKRLDKGISYTEFSYMILQAIDFHNLYCNYKVQMQFGGSDQWGNITSGLELIRKLEGKKTLDEKPLGMSTHLLLKRDGTKFGKSEQGTLWLDPKLTNPYQIYQYFINTEDEEVIRYLKSLTLLSPNEIIELEKDNKINPQNKLAQKKLAEEIVIFLHGEKELKKCLEVNKVLFGNQNKPIKETIYILLEKILFSHRAKEDIKLIDALVKTKLASSKTEARQLISVGSIQIFNKKVTEINFVLKQKEAVYERYFLLKKSKKHNALIVFESIKID